MKKANRSIKENFKLYRNLADKIKRSATNRIILIQGTGGHKKWLLGDVMLDFTTQHKGKLSIRQGCSHLVDYGFQIFADFFTSPILRFDADGVTHYNSKDETIPLLEREIKTPHFHRYDKDGIEQAYRTPFIDKNEFDIQNNIQLGLNVFCSENFVNSNTREGTLIQESIKITSQSELFPEQIINDVHKGIKFI